MKWLQIKQGIALIGSIVTLFMFIKTESNYYGFMTVLGILLYQDYKMDELKILIKGE